MGMGDSQPQAYLLDITQVDPAAKPDVQGIILAGTLTLDSRVLDFELPTLNADVEGLMLFRQVMLDRSFRRAAASRL